MCAMARRCLQRRHLRCRSGGGGCQGAAFSTQQALLNPMATANDKPHHGAPRVHCSHLCKVKVSQNVWPMSTSGNTGWPTPAFPAWQLMTSEQRHNCSARCAPLPAPAVMQRLMTVAAEHMPQWRRPCTLADARPSTVQQALQVHAVDAMHPSAAATDTADQCFPPGGRGGGSYRWDISGNSGNVSV